MFAVAKGCGDRHGHVVYWCRCPVCLISTPWRLPCCQPARRSRWGLITQPPCRASFSRETCWRVASLVPAERYPESQLWVQTHHPHTHTCAWFWSPHPALRNTASSSNQELERLWREYDKIEGEVTVTKNILLEQLEALGSPQVL